MIAVVPAGGVGAAGLFVVLLAVWLWMLWVLWSRAGYFACLAYHRAVAAYWRWRKNREIEIVVRRVPPSERARVRSALYLACIERDLNRLRELCRREAGGPGERDQA